MFDDHKLGPTGEFPEGKLRDDDEGELKAAIGHSKGQVVIDYGAPVTWVSMPPAAARQLAVHLMQHARAVDGRGPVIVIHDEDGL